MTNYKLEFVGSMTHDYVNRVLRGRYEWSCESGECGLRSWSGVLWRGSDAPSTEDIALNVCGDLVIVVGGIDAMTAYVAEWATLVHAIKQLNKFHRGAVVDVFGNNLIILDQFLGRAKPRKHHAKVMFEICRRTIECNDITIVPHRGATLLIHN